MTHRSVHEILRLSDDEINKLSARELRSTIIAEKQTDTHTITDTSLSRLREDIAKLLSNQTETLQAVIEKQNKKIDQLENIVRTQQSTILQLQRKEVAQNIIISGIPENNNDDADNIKEVLATLECQKPIEVTTRIGMKIHNKPRLLKVTFKNIQDSKLAIRNAKQLRNSNKFKGIYVNPDQIYADRIESRRIREKYKLLVSQNSANEVKIKKGILYLNDEEVDRQDPISQVFQ